MYQKNFVLIFCMSILLHSATFGMKRAASDDLDIHRYKCEFCFYDEIANNETPALHLMTKHSGIVKTSYVSFPKKRKIEESLSLEESSSVVLEKEVSTDVILESDIYLARKVVNKHICTQASCGIGSCRFSHGNEQVMKCHLKLHSNDNCHICKICDFRSKNRRVFRNHQDTHLPKSERDGNICPYCFRKLAKPSSLWRHIKGQHSKDSNPKNSKFIKGKYNLKDEDYSE